MTNYFEKQEKTAVKTRYWEAIAYPENMLQNWPDLIADFVQVPCAWALHDKDVVGDKWGDQVGKRKDHIHILLAFDGPTTEATIKRTINALSLPGKKCCPRAIPVINVKSAYKYLIHDTESAKASGKFQYDPSERHTCNNFDIGIYINITAAQKSAALDQMTEVILNGTFYNLFDFVKGWVRIQDDPDGILKQTVQSHSGYLERLLKGCYLYHHPSAYRNSGI